MELDLYVDADFSGLWNYEDYQYLICVKSITVYVLTLGRCFIIWISKLHPEISLSTTEVEYNSLSQAMREIVPMCHLLLEIATEMNLVGGGTAVINSTVFEENSGALITDNSVKINYRTKHLGVKYHFFKASLCKSQWHHTRQG